MNIRQRIAAAVLAAGLGSGAAHAGLYLDHGRLATDQAGTVTYTLVGYEAAHQNVFFVDGDWVFDRLDVGDSFATAVEPGRLRFAFADFTTFVLGRNGNGGRIAVTANGDGGYLLGFDDTRGRRDHDFNDMRVLVSFVLAVPEPAGHALFLVGLGLLGALARCARRTDASVRGQADGEESCRQ